MEILDFVRIFFALFAVIGMIGLAALAAKKFGLQNGALALGRTRRLAIVETLAIDQRRRLAIIACDGREHLILLDNGNATLIETGLPAREQADAVDPIAAFANASAGKPLQMSATVAKFMRRAPEDRTMALRAAGLI